MKMLPLLCLWSPWFGVSSALEIRAVAEGEDALLPCILNSGQSIDKFDWRTDGGLEKLDVFAYKEGKIEKQDQQFTGRVEFFQDELKSGNASIIIRNTRLEDSGTYTCGLYELYRPVHIKLHVVGDLKTRNISGAAPLPYCNQVPVKKDMTSLECITQGVPQPEVQWINSAGNPFPAEETHVTRRKDASGRFHVELRVNVTSSDTYTCMVTQKDIYHQIYCTEIVRIPDAVKSVAVSEGDDAVLPCSLNSKHNIESVVFSWSKDDEKLLLYDRSQVKEDAQVKGRITLFQEELQFGNASIKIYNTQKADGGHYTCHLSDIQESHVFLQVEESLISSKTMTTQVLVVVLGVLLVLAVVVLCYCIRRRRKQYRCANSVSQETDPKWSP